MNGRRPFRHEAVDRPRLLCETTAVFRRDCGQRV